MIEAENISVSIARRTILSDVSVVAEAGQVTAIIGPNGSGKTTLLRAIAGDIAASGVIRINGLDISKLRPWQLAALRAVLPQQATLAFPFTVREVVALGLTDASRSGTARRPEEALARVDLAGFGGRMYQELSGGEQQRVQLARVLCQVWSPLSDEGPRWLLLDEPITGLDIKHQLVVMRLAQDFARAGGGVLAVMHDLNLTAAFADRIIAMHAGRPLAAGAPGAVLTDRILSEAFDCPIQVGALPKGERPFVLPHPIE